MKETILLVGHGSRNPDGNREIEEFARLWRERQPGWRIEVCFIEFADQLVAEGLALASHDADRVIVVPLILNAAGHVKMDLPEHIEAARAQFPATEFRYVPHLGAETSILEVLQRRLHQAMDELDRPDPQTTGVILLGRGSSDPMANGEVAKMARWLFEASDHNLVDIAFTGVTYPRLERVVQRQALLGMTQIVVLPYYLFTGTLMERIKRQTGHLQQQYPLVRFARSTYFGFEEEIFDLLELRVREGQEGISLLACDGCKYREMAPKEGGGHHHPAPPQDAAPSQGYDFGHGKRSHHLGPHPTPRGGRQ
ncbi:MAG: sirohydrochlorin chelatase [Chromatiaceae bacterium]